MLCDHAELELVLSEYFPKPIALRILDYCVEAEDDADAYDYWWMDDHYGYFPT
jgi:hypothetical protein